MTRATISQAKNNLSRLLDAVRHGETVIILDRNRPVARLEPVAAPDSPDEDGRLLRLQRAGLLMPARRPGLPKRFLGEALPTLRKGARGAVAALIAEREESR